MKPGSDTTELSDFLDSVVAQCCGSNSRSVEFTLEELLPWLAQFLSQHVIFFSGNFDNPEEQTTMTKTCKK